MSKRIHSVNTPASSHSRIRTVEPYTLFESTHRYSKNDLWVESIAGTGTSIFSEFEGVVDHTIGTTNGDKIISESSRVFAYQPGKRLHIMNSFLFGNDKTNLTQRIGYFGTDNGIYLELADNTIYFVRRTIVSGTISEKRVSQSNWNLDRLDGSGESLLILDITKTQILWANVEWLGAGTIDMGFYLNGNLISCHSFHHANLTETAYLTTASLPLRQEIFNTGETSSTSRSKQICATVISEGGYVLSGRQQAIGTPLTGAIRLATVGIFYPIVSLRLKNSRLDAIAIVGDMAITGATTAIYNWQIRSRGVSSGGSWSTFEVKSDEYNVADQFETDLTALISNIGGLDNTVVHAQAYGDGEVITSGTYTTAGAATHGGNIVFDGEDDEDAMFVFRLGGTMGLAASATSTLINGAKASNIFWLINSGALSIGATCNLKGTYISNGAVAPGDVFTLEGRILSTSGAIGMTNATYTRPFGTPSLVIGTLRTVAIFTVAGAISNTIVTGGIGDVCSGNNGAISGFDTIEGTVYINSDTLFSGNEFSNASVSYNITGTGYKGGRILASGYMKDTAVINIDRRDLFKFQLERDTLSETPFELTLLCSSTVTNSDVFGSLNWEEISR